MNIDFSSPEARIYFKMSPEKKTALLKRMKLIEPSVSFPQAYRNENRPLNEDFLKKALAQKAKTVISSLRNTSCAQITAAKEAGVCVGVGPAQNLNDIIAGILKQPDFIVADRMLAEDAVRSELMKDYSDRVVFYREAIDLNQAGDWTLNFQTAQTRSPGTDLRVMSFNILSSLWTQEPCVWARGDRLGEILRAFAPDAAGLQEVDPKWYKEASAKITPYKFANNGDHASQIVYHPERLRELEGGVFQITDGWIRCVNWVKFEDRKTGKTFIVGCTHWNLTAAKRVKDGMKMAEFVNRMKAAHRCPVFFTGDYNSDVDEEGYKTLLAETGLKDSVECASYTENKNISSYYWPLFFNTPYKHVKHIDHITYADEFCTPLSARLILGRPSLSISDHLPLVVDYQWK